MAPSPGHPGGGRTRTRLEPAQRRASILDAAEAVLAGRDPADLTFEELAEAAGVSRALVYNYFGDRGGVLAAVYLRTVERLDRELAPVLASDAPAEERLRQAIATYLRFAREHVDLWRVVSQAELMHHPRVVAARRDRYATLTAAWGGSPEARLIARGVLALLESTALGLAEEPGDLPEDRAVDLLHTLLWQGLAAYR